MMNKLLSMTGLLLLLSACDNQASRHLQDIYQEWFHSNQQAQSLLPELDQIYLKQQKQALPAIMAEAGHLQDSVQHLLESPTTENLSQAQHQWQMSFSQFASQHYFQEQHQQMKELLRFVDPRPIIPGYVDSLKSYPYSGIVNDVTVTLNEESLRQQHQRGDAEEASLGFGVIYLLLHGTDQPRRAADFEAFGSSPTYIERRRQYLALASEILVKDLQALNNASQDKNNRPNSEIIIQQLQTTAARDTNPTSPAQLRHQGFSQWQQALLNSSASAERSVREMIQEKHPDFLSTSQP